MRVLVTDGDSRAALAVTRSLGRRGHDVLVGGTHARTLSHGSRYCKERVVYPDPITCPDLFVQAIAEIVRLRRIDVLLPVADVTTFMVAGDRERLGCLVPIPPLAVIERAANKVDIMQTAEGLGVPVPRGSVVVGPDGVAGLQLEFPVVIKPWRSRVRCDGRWHALSVSYAANRDELDRDLRDRPPYAFPLLLQERIEGPGIGIFACFDSGRPVAMFGHRRLRERPPWGGVSVLSESIALDPDTASHATRLLASIGWQGPAMVEFKVDVRDGLPKLMEINGRFWGSLQLAIDAGVDFPALALQALRDEPFPLQRPYRVGIQSRWLWGDVDSLMLSLRARTRARMPASAPGRLAAIGTFLKLWGRDLYYDNPKWSDPWPWVVETSSRLAVLGRFLHRSPARPITPGPSAPQVGV